MKHHRHTIRLGRQRSHYKETLRHLVSSLVLNKSINTTKVKAREASRLADRLVTVGKENCVANQRKAYRILGDRDLVKILFNEIAPLFKSRNGGYTRILLTTRRRGDNAQMAMLEFVEKPKKEPLSKKEEKKKPIQPEKQALEKKEVPKVVKPAKEEIVKETKDEKVIGPPKEPETPKAPKQKPEKKSGFFKRLFGRKKEM